MRKCVNGTSSYTNDSVLYLATMVNSSVTRTDQAADRSGWMTLSALDVKQTYGSVDMQDGELTTVSIPRTSLYRVW